MERIYLSLPITGKDINERVTYARVQAMCLREMTGLSVFNPLEQYNEDEPPKSWEYYMGYDLSRMSTFSSEDCIVLCPGWATSKGCRLEYYFAQNLGMHIWEMDDKGRVRNLDDASDILENNY